MPPPIWPLRLLPGSNTPNAPNSSQSSSSRSGNRSLPALPQTSEPDATTGPPSPTRTRNVPRQHAHNRSSSHPLPRLFSRKKSSGALGGNIDLNAPPDDSLVPVLDQHGLGSPDRTTSTRRIYNEDPNATKHCMCCFIRCRFPKDLTVFRCTNCMTINDLRPHIPEEKRDGPQADDQKAADPRASYFFVPKPVLPLSIEMTRAIINNCLMTYLEARVAECLDGIQDKAMGMKKGQSIAVDSAKDVTFSDSALSPRKVSPRDVASPTDLVVPVEPLSATINTISDFGSIDPAGYFNGPSILPQSPPSRESQADQSTRIARKPVPPRPDRRPPPPPVQTSAPAVMRSQSTRPNVIRHITPPGIVPRRPIGGPEARQADEIERYERARKIFRPLEDYMLENYGRFESLNVSFNTVRPDPKGRTHSESAIRTPPPEPFMGTINEPSDHLPQIDAKTLLLGDVAENGDWWTGGLGRNYSERVDKRGAKVGGKRGAVTSKTAFIDWDRLGKWYEMIDSAGRSWSDMVGDLKGGAGVAERVKGSRNSVEIDSDLSIARDHAERALFKITEGVLRRPGRPLTEPEDFRFLLLILSNPSLYPHLARMKIRADSARPRLDRGPSSRQRLPSDGALQPLQNSQTPQRSPTRMQPRDPSMHSGLLKRILGLLAHSPDNCHRYLVGWFSRMPEQRFRDLVDLVASFITYRLSKRRARQRSGSATQDGGLIPDLSGSAMQTSLQFQGATGLSGGIKKKEDDGVQSVIDYSEDWQLRAAAKVMALLFAANNVWQSNNEARPFQQPDSGLSKPRTKTYGQLLFTSDFYNTLTDYGDIIADFKAWESKKVKFALCQYPFLLSVGSKIRILEFDARRQMENKAREAQFAKISYGRATETHLSLQVRRDCVVDDSLRQISETVGAGQEDFKKGLRIKFAGEEGVDAGGLRKEWFLMLVRDIFDPNYGMFLYDDESHTCYFNPNSWETTDQYYLVGVLLGLAIYNSTILDVALPPFAFRKLLASAPASATNPSLPTAGARGLMTYTVDDLAEYMPALAAGLRQLLAFDGDVETTFCRDFVVPIDRYGAITYHPLCTGGENKPVTNANRQEFVDLYVRYLLDTAVSRQFEPFKRGFFTVCAGNALSLFRAEEIELLVRGSEEALDVNSLKAVAVYENWKSPGGSALPNPAATIPVIGWFWDFFVNASPVDQRKLLAFITSSDRIPATGTTNLVLRIVGGGDGTGADERENRASDRYPVARTCFNMLVLWRYETREKMVEKMSGALSESEGFGLK